MRKRFFWGMPTMFLVIGCATRTPQTDAFFRKERIASAEHIISDVPFYLQKEGHCGPASLAMVLNWYKLDISVDTLATQMYSPGAKGSFQLDMISAARRNQLLAIPIRGFEQLTNEVSNQHPVIIFENLGLSWAPVWHYAVVFGYDLQKRELVMHSGPDRSKRESFRVFENSWKLADYWGLVVLPPGQLAPSADEVTHVNAAAALEQLNFNEAADRSYEAILEKWPESLGALIGRANISFAKKNVRNAIAYLQRAVQHHPSAAAAWHNLAVAQSAAKQQREAKKSAEQALQFASHEQKVDFLNNLKGIISAPN